MLRYKIVKKMLLELLADYPINERIPSRNALMKSLDASRMTIDKVVAELEEEGTLYSEKGRGTFIKAGTKPNDSDEESSWCLLLPAIAPPQSFLTKRGAFKENFRSIYSLFRDGVIEVASSAGIHLVVCNTNDDYDNQMKHIRMMRVAGIKNFIVVPQTIDHGIEALNGYQALVREGCRLIMLSRDVDGMDVPVVKTSDFYGGYVATRHLIEKGYRKIAYISTTRFRTSFERCQGYISALMEADLPIERKLIYIPAESGIKVDPLVTLENMLQEVPDLDGVFCFNDLVAETVYYVLNSRGRKVSDEVGIIGFIDMDFAATLDPPLTTVSIEAEKVGRLAGEVMLKWQKGAPLSNFNQYLIQPELVIRESCRGKERPASVI